MCNALSLKRCRLLLVNGVFCVAECFISVFAGVKTKFYKKITFRPIVIIISFTTWVDRQAAPHGTVRYGAAPCVVLRCGVGRGVNVRVYFDVYVGDIADIGVIISH